MKQEHPEVPATPQINADMRQFVIVRAAELRWEASPSATVERKRFHLAGPAEAGQVTSLVRYLMDSTFHAHDHPDGEEILVLDGIFSDEQGDWPAGSWFLNPEGFRHQPCSGPGCLLFVKLRQYPGSDHRAIDIDDVRWEDAEGFRFRELHASGDGERTRVIEPGPAETLFAPHGGAEGFVVSGTVRVGERELVQHDWFRVPVGQSLSISSPDGARLYWKENAVARLASVA